jgi:ureidoacrylate peracid hydrolase
MVDLLNCAVLVVDIQNDWCHEDGAYAKAGNDVSIFQKTVPKVEFFLTEARRYQVPIIHIPTTHSKWTDSPSWRSRLRKWSLDFTTFLHPGTWGADFYKIIPQADDHVIIKHRFSGFVNTELDLVLRSRGIRTIIMTGFASDVCVGYTGLHGFMKDYYVVLLDDCSATFTAEAHKTACSFFGELFAKVTTSQTLVKAWRIAKGGEKSQGRKSVDSIR